MTGVRLDDVAAALVRVRGVRGVALGGSRARRTHHADSDFDLGLYLDGDLDLAALAALARQVGGPGSAVTGRGEWGPWVDGGAWLEIAGTRVDWLYRDLARVDRAWLDAEAGRFAFHTQTGHPLGFLDVVYAGELASARVLADPDGALAERQRRMATYPPALADALVARLGEAQFLLGAIGKGTARGDTTWVAGNLFRVVLLCAHAVHARAGVWLLNEKGAVAATAALPDAPDDFAARAHTALGALGTDAATLSAGVAAVRSLLDDTLRRTA